MKIKDTIEFSIDNVKQKGNVLGMDEENVTINLFATRTPDNKWYYFGVSNKSQFKISDLKDIVVISKEM